MAYRLMKKGRAKKIYKPSYKPWTFQLGAGVEAERKMAGDVILVGTGSIIVMTAGEARNLYKKLSGDYKD